MNRFLSNKKYHWIAVVLIAFVLSLVTELAGFMVNSHIVCSEQYVSAMTAQDIQIQSEGYSVEGNRYVQNNDDPHLVVTGIDTPIRYVTVWFRTPIFEKAKIQVYYRKEGDPYCEADATIRTRVPFGCTQYSVEIPQGQYEDLRLDIDGDYTLRDVLVSTAPVKIVRQLDGSFRIGRFLAMVTALCGAGALFLFWFHSPKSRVKLSKYEVLFCAVCFVFYTLWAIAQPITYSPDEQMRFEVTQFLFEHNRLPINDELISMPWGFSYAHFPIVLCNMLGYVFMKAASLFVTGPFELLVAARMVSVCAGTGVVYYVIKVSKLLFRTSARYVMIAFVAFMPQFVFLCSYENNDSLALLGVAMIFYSWIAALEFKWNWRSALLLALGVAICGLAYYNSYFWILMSVLFFVVSYYYQNKKDHKGFVKMLLFIVAIVLLLISYNFVRQFVLYGDLFGFKPRRYYGELYGENYLKPSITQTAQELGVPFWDVMVKEPYEYIDKTWKSFVGVFSYMSVFCPDGIYSGVFAFVCVTMSGLVLKVALDIVRKRRYDPMKLLAIACAFVSSAVAIGLAVYKSYTGDFQPQGRYSYPAFVFIAFLVAKGYEWFIGFIRRREHCYAITAMVCTAFAAMAYYAYVCVFLPS